jgi:hypothetical protein
MRKTTLFVLLVAGLAVAGLAAIAARASIGDIVGEVKSVLAPVFLASDIVVEPGKDVTLDVRLRADLFLKGAEGKRVQFLLDDKIIGEVKTDRRGDAALAWKVPAKAGDYVIQVQVRAEDQPSTIIPPADILVAARAADAPMIVVDLDKTVVASGFAHVLTGTAEPMAGAAAVLARAAQTQTVIYLTQRPDFLGPMSKKWLADNGFPRGPMVTGTLTSLAAGGAFKSSRLTELRKTYKHILFGIGDKSSDAQAYADNGVKPILIMPVNWADADPAYFERLAKDLAAAPPSSQVVTGWAEISAIFFDKAEHTKKAMVDRLLDTAGKLRAKKKG